MTTDPIDRLRDELIAAGRRRWPQQGQRAYQRRRWLIGGVTAVAMLVTVPLAGSLSGTAPVGEGTTTKGVAYVVEQVSGARIERSMGQRPGDGDICQQVTLLHFEGEVKSRFHVCSPAGSHAPLIGKALFMTLVQDGVLVFGSVAPEVARVTVSGASAVSLQSVDGTGRRAFVAMSAAESPVVTALDKSGRAISRRALVAPAPVHPAPDG